MKFESIAFILLTKTTAAQNEVALSYHKLRGLYFLAVVFVATIIHIIIHRCTVIKTEHCSININLLIR